jgi:hypothetical protein
MEAGSLRPSLQHLPNEVLCQIICGLETKKDIRSLVFASKLLQELVYYSWSKLTLKYDNKLNYHSFLTLPAERLNYLLELDISNCDQMTNSLFQQILAKTPNLQVLRMKNCKRLTRAAAKQVALKLPSLRAVDIRGFNPEELDHIDLGKTKLSALRELRLTSFLGPLRESIIPQNITTLVLSTRMLNEEVWSYVNVRRLEYVPVDWKADLTGCFPHLESLKVGAVENLILGHRPNLTHLDFGMLSNFGPSLWPDVPNLKSLKISLAKQDYVFLLKDFPNLQELSINRFIYIWQDLVDHKILTKFASSAPKVELVNVAQVLAANPNLTDLRLPNLEVTKEILDALIKLKNLRKLHVSKMTDELMTSDKWSKLTALKELLIMPQFHLSPKVKWHTGIKNIPNLEVLKLSVDDIHFSHGTCEYLPQEINEGFKSLRRLILGGRLFEPFKKELTDSRFLSHLAYVKCSKESFK